MNVKRLFIICVLAVPARCHAMSAVAQAIQEMRPGALWMLDGDSYDGLTWLDKNQPKPTKAEVLNTVATIEVLEKRKAEYPTLEQKVDALLSGPLEIMKIKKQISDVNTKYPLP